MAEDIKQKQARAKEKIINILTNSGYRVFLLKNNVFDLQAIREKEIRMIKVVCDKITDNNEKLIKEFKSPEICTKEMWYSRKKTLFDRRPFKIKIID